jgi:hypothetical protein
VDELPMCTDFGETIIKNGVHFGESLFASSLCFFFYWLHLGVISVWSSPSLFLSRAT